MKKSFSMLAVVACFLFACNSSSDSGSTGTTGTADTALQQYPPAETQNPASEAQSMPAAVPENSQVITAPVSRPAGTPQVTATGMNPPHGEPGHRCDIDVGAPLSSQPKAPPMNAAPQNISQQPTIISAPSAATPQITPAPATTPTATAPGMNPPHGEPGHDCSISVGAPLKK